MVMNVHILVTCRGQEHLPLSLLVFDTIRVGFPTARLHVCDNASDFGGTAIATKAEEIGAGFTSMTERIEHGDFIAARLSVADASTVFVDTDVIFWESCEDIVLPEGKLYGGRLIPEIVECGAWMPARIHPSLFFVPDPAALRAALAGFTKKFWYFRPFQGYTTTGPDGAVCWDTCASLYAALPEAAYAFGEAELDRYDHLFAGTYPDRLEGMETAPATAAALRETHALALGPKRAALRGLWRKQGLEQDRRSSWHYWSGVLFDHNQLPRFGLMHARFEAPGVAPFKHTAIVDLVLNKVYAGDHEMLPVSIPDLPAPANPQQHATPDGEYHASDQIHLHGVTLRIGGDTYKNLGGSLWYDREKREVKPGEGWRWISMRLFNGNSFMFYDRSDAPPRYEVRADEGWCPVQAVVDILGRDIYESCWGVRLGNKLFRLVPVVNGQEIVDVARGASYLEALCDVFSEDGMRAGSAYVEVVPVKKAVGRPVVSKPAEVEMHLRWAQNDPDAAFLIDCFGYATQLADDLVDLDREGVKTVRGRSHVMAEILYVLLIRIPGNPFFRKNEMHFVPLFTNCLVQWDASNEWAESQKKETRIFAYVQRETTARLVEQVAYLVGGFQWAKTVAREIHDYYHGLHGVEPFDAWDAERKGATA